MISYAPIPCLVFCSILWLIVVLPLDLLFARLTPFCFADPTPYSPSCCSSSLSYARSKIVIYLLKYLDVLCNVSRKT